MYRTEHDGASDRGEPSLGDILRDLSKNTVDLARSGVQLAMAEVSRKVSKAGKDSQIITIGAFITYAGFLFVLAAAVIALSLLIPVGWAAFAVGVAALIGGAITIRIGKKRISEENLLPSETLDTLKEDAKWMRNQLM
jgi:hypothetical protein